MLRTDVAYSYQSYQEDILSNAELSVRKWNIYSIIVSQELEIDPPLSLGWSGQSQEGSGSL